MFTSFIAISPCIFYFTFFKFYCQRFQIIPDWSVNFFEWKDSNFIRFWKAYFRHICVKNLWNNLVFRADFRLAVTKIFSFKTARIWNPISYVQSGISSLQAYERMSKKKTFRWVGNPTFTAYLVRIFSLCRWHLFSSLLY